MRKKAPDLNKGSCGLQEPTEQGPGGKLYVHSLPHVPWSRLRAAGAWGGRNKQPQPSPLPCGAAPRASGVSTESQPPTPPDSSAPIQPRADPDPATVGNTSSLITAALALT